MFQDGRGYTGGPCFRKLEKQNTLDTVRFCNSWYKPKKKKVFLCISKSFCDSYPKRIKQTVPLGIMSRASAFTQKACSPSWTSNVILEFSSMLPLKNPLKKITLYFQSTGYKLWKLMVFSLSIKLKTRSCLCRSLGFPSLVCRLDYRPLNFHSPHLFFVSFENVCS